MNHNVYVVFLYETEDEIEELNLFNYSCDEIPPYRKGQPIFFNNEHKNEWRDFIIKEINHSVTRYWDKDKIKLIRKVEVYLET